MPNQAVYNPPTSPQDRRDELRQVATRMVAHGALWTAGGTALAIASAALAGGVVPLVAGLIGVAVGLADLGRGAILLSQ